MGYTAGSQPTGALWTQASLAVAALLSLRRSVSRHLALLGLPVVLLWYNIRWSAGKLAMAGGTPCKSSGNTVGRRAGAAQDQYACLTESNHAVPSSLTEDTTDSDNDSSDEVPCDANLPKTDDPAKLQEV